MADRAPSRGNATTMGIGSDLEFGIVWQNRTHRGCGFATQSHPTVFQSSQVVCQNVLTHLTTQCNERIKGKQEQNSREDLQEHVLRRGSLLTGPILLDQSQNTGDLIIQLIVLLRRRCLRIGPSCEVFGHSGNGRNFLANLRQLHFVVGVFLRDRQTVRQVIHELLQAGLLFALAIMGGAGCVLRRLSLGRTFLRRSPLDFFQGRKLDRHPLVFGSPEKCGESSNAYEHGVDTHRIGGCLDCLLLLADPEDCHGHLPHGYRTLCRPPRSRLVGQAAVGGVGDPCGDLLGSCDVGCLE